MKKNEYIYYLLIIAALAFLWGIVEPNKTNNMKDLIKTFMED